MTSITPFKGLAYRYRGFSKFDEKYKDRIRKMFSNRELYFSNILEFNDPFECNPTTEYKPESLRKYLQEVAKKYSVKPKPGLISEQMSHYAEKGFQETYQKYLSEHVGVCCMSKRPDIITQWAYYGENGKGFCIEYDVGNIPTIASIEVSYSDSRPAIDIVKFQKDTHYQFDKLKEIISKKSIQWVHEEEIRLFTASIGAILIPKNAIKSIIFGALIDNEKKEWLLATVKEYAPEINIYSAKLCHKKFKLNIEPYI